MPTRHIILTDQDERLIEELVAKGRFENASEVVREGLRLVDSRETQDAEKLKALRAAVQVGIDDIERGDYKEFEDVPALVNYLDKLANKVLGKSKRN